jgi:hypothetical protein
MPTKYVKTHAPTSQRAKQGNMHIIFDIAIHVRPRERFVKKTDD